MNELTVSGLNNMLANCDMNGVIENVLELPQASCPVRHIFGAGVYIREISIKAGVFSIGHIQKKKHLNQIVKGRVLMLKEDGTTYEVAAPQVFVGNPGRKVGLILEDMVWQNIYPTDETDVDKLEEMYLDKIDTWIDHDKQKASIEYFINHQNRVDFDLMLKEVDLTAEIVQAQTEIESDLIPLPSGEYKMKISDSYIHGRGVFVTSPIEAGEVIAPARIDGKRTTAGRYTNHAKNPNAKMIMRSNGDIDLVAITPIDGCYGGDHGTEVTVDYRQVILEKGDS